MRSRGSPTRIDGKRDRAWENRKPVVVSRLTSPIHTKPPGTTSPVVTAGRLCRMSLISAYPDLSESAPPVGCASPVDLPPPGVVGLRVWGSLSRKASLADPSAKQHNEQHAQYSKSYGRNEGGRRQPDRSRE